MSSFGRKEAEYYETFVERHGGTMKSEGGQRARVHPGKVHHSMDHYVLDTRTSDGTIAAYFSVYSIAYMPEVGTGCVAFLRIRDASGDLARELVVADTVELGVRMQARLRRIIDTSDVSVGIGPNLEVEPVVGSFQRQPWLEGPGYVITAGGESLQAQWRQPGTAQWIAAPKRSFHHERDIVGTMIPYLSADLIVNGVQIPGAPYEDPWWKHRLDVPFSSTHVSLGDTALEAGSDWWGEAL